MANRVSSKWRRIAKDIPGYDPWRDADGFHFDAVAAEEAIDFFHECIRHVKGVKAGQPIKLERWQQAIIINLFAWKRKDGTRRYREALVFIPRKNGKTTIASGLVLLVLFCDGEPGAEIYSAAADREQASIIYNISKQMMLTDDAMRDMGKARDSYKSITYQGMNGSYKAISSEANTKHGYNGHLIVIDELHAQPNRELVDVLMTSTGSRTQPLVVHITTSDYERESICNEKHDYASKVRDGIIDDPSFLPVIYEAGRDDDWTDRSVWKKANPNLGISVSEEYLVRECKRAQDSPVYENTFKRLHLNIRTEQDVRWLQMDKWDACAGDTNEPNLVGKRCYAGLDLANTTDIAALVLYFPDDNHAVLPFFWVPEDNAHKREKRDRVPYLRWAQDELIELTPGNVIDYRFIRERINELSHIYDMPEIAYDPWNARQVALQLAEEDGFEMVEFRQGMVSMNEPAKHMEALVLKGSLRHGGNAVLRWMASNVTVRTDPSSNIRIDKAKSTEKVDGIVALCMAIGRAIATVDQTSVYDTRGLLSV